MVAGIALPVVILFAGTALDYSRLNLAHTQLQSAADAAALHAAKTATRAEATAQVNAVFASAAYKSMMDGNEVTATLTAYSVGNAEVTASVEVPLTFAAMFGDMEKTVGVKAAASIGRSASSGRALDIAMCIDSTGSMQFIIDSVKNAAVGFAANLNANFQAKGLAPFDSIRVRPIFFRDFGGNNPDYRSDHYDVSSGGYIDLFPNGNAWKPAGDSRFYGDDVPIHAAADFYALPTNESALQAFVAPELAYGGGDYVESGMECLNEAMDSIWTRPGSTISTPGGPMTAATVFTVVAIWTDQDAHPPGFSWSLLNATYPPGSKMPRSYAALQAKWNNEAVIPQGNKLLAFFIPRDFPNWAPIRLWDHYLAAGTLTQGTNAVVSAIADAVATIDRAAGPKTVRLTK